MKVYVLTGKDTVGYRTVNPSDIVKKLSLMKSDGIDLSDFTIMIIDLDRYPPVYKTIEDFLKSADEEK